MWELRETVKVSHELCRGGQGSHDDRRRELAIHYVTKQDASPARPTDHGAFLGSFLYNLKLLRQDSRLCL